MSEAKTNIMNRLRAGSQVEPYYKNDLTQREDEWQSLQPPVRDLAEQFIKGMEAVGGVVFTLSSWADLGDLADQCMTKYGIKSFIAGTDERLAPMGQHLKEKARWHTFDQPLDACRETLFEADCGVTTSIGAIADTASVVLVPGPEEPRSLSLVPPVHLVVVERKELHATLGHFLKTEKYQTEMPTNLVLVSGPSRTGDIELVLTIGVHGPKVFLVALIG